MLSREMGVRISALFMQHMNNATQMINYWRPDVPEREVKPMRKWQRELYNLLMTKPDDRNIIWIHDSAGNAGKSTFAQTYRQLHPYDSVSVSGKEGDIAFVIDRQRVVFFDIPRQAGVSMQTQADLFVVAERLKSGEIMSTKYFSTVKRMEPPHGVFFSNNVPLDGAWSVDRVWQYTLDTTLCADWQSHAPGAECSVCSRDMLPAGVAHGDLLRVKRMNAFNAMGGESPLLPVTHYGADAPVKSYFAAAGGAGISQEL